MGNERFLLHDLVVKLELIPFFFLIASVSLSFPRQENPAKDRTSVEPPAPTLHRKDEMLNPGKRV